MDDVNDTILNRIIDKLKEISEWMEEAAPDDRLEIRNYLMQDYCEHCGISEKKYGTCHCNNDE